MFYLSERSPLPSVFDSFVFVRVFCFFYETVQKLEGASPNPTASHSADKKKHVKQRDKTFDVAALLVYVSIIHK